MRRILIGDMRPDDYGTLRITCQRPFTCRPFGILWRASGPAKGNTHRSRHILELSKNPHRSVVTWPPEHEAASIVGDHKGITRFWRSCDSARNSLNPLSGSNRISPLSANRSAIESAWISAMIRAGTRASRIAGPPSSGKSACVFCAWCPNGWTYLGSTEHKSHYQTLGPRSGSRSGSERRQYGAARTMAAASDGQRTDRGTMSWESR